VTTFGEKDLIFPVTKFGVSIISTGFFIDRNQSLIWRGPMAAKAMLQLFQDTQWGDIDYMFVDFPPGTGDIQLSTIQSLNLSGAIIVTTPQEIALNDARKATSMFTNPDLKVPLLGIIENMSWFTPEKHPDEKYYIFGKGGGHKLALEYDTWLLGQIPLVMEVGEAAEKGLSVFSQTNRAVAETFENISDLLISKI
jgi:ATP-binding protein involved in chromosome partitioning